MNIEELVNGILEKLAKGIPLDKKEVAAVKGALEQNMRNAMLFAKAFLYQYREILKNDGVKARQARIRLELLVKKALQNILDGKKAFSGEDMEVLIEVFNDLGMDGPKVARSFVANFNLLFGQSFAETLRNISKEEQKAAGIGIKQENKEEEGKLTL